MAAFNLAKTAFSQGPVEPKGYVGQCPGPGFPGPGQKYFGVKEAKGFNQEKEKTTCSILAEVIFAIFTFQN